MLNTPIAVKFSCCAHAEQTPRCQIFLGVRMLNTVILSIDPVRTVYCGSIWPVGRHVPTDRAGACFCAFSPKAYLGLTCMI